MELTQQAEKTLKLILTYLDSGDEIKIIELSNYIEKLEDSEHSKFIKSLEELQSNNLITFEEDIANGINRLDITNQAIHYFELMTKKSRKERKNKIMSFLKDIILLILGAIIGIIINNIFVKLF